MTVCAAECPGKLIIFGKGCLPVYAGGRRTVLYKLRSLCNRLPGGGHNLEYYGAGRVSCNRTRLASRSGSGQTSHAFPTLGAGYKKQPVEHDRLAHLIDTAQYAPTGSNKQAGLLDSS